MNNLSDFANFDEIQIACHLFREKNKIFDFIERLSLDTSNEHRLTVEPLSPCCFLHQGFGSLWSVGFEIRCSWGSCCA